MECGREDRNETSGWIEDTPDMLGIHSIGAPLKTVDELYADCRDILTTKNDEQKYSISLDFYTNGVLSYCRYTRKNCADDCTSGVFIDNLTFTQ